MRVAFIGLGVMGYPMAGYLARNEHDVTVYNRTAQKAERWCAEYGGRMAATPAEAAGSAEFVFACVGNDADVREVLAGEQGAIKAMQAGSVLVDHTTASAAVARAMYALAAEHSVAFLDAPVSGGQAGAESGQLTIMVGGDEDVFERAVAVMDCYAKAMTLIGGVGSGQLAKAVNQICIAGVVQGLADPVSSQPMPCLLIACHQAGCRTKCASRVLSFTLRIMGLRKTVLKSPLS